MNLGDYICITILEIEEDCHMFSLHQKSFLLKLGCFHREITYQIQGRESLHW